MALSIDSWSKELTCSSPRLLLNLMLGGKPQAGYEPSSAGKIKGSPFSADVGVGAGGSSSGNAGDGVEEGVHSCVGGNNNKDGDAGATHGAGAGAGESKSNGACNTSSGGDGIKDRGEGQSSGNGSDVDSNLGSGDDSDDDGDDWESSDSADSPLPPHASSSPPKQARCFNCNVLGGYDGRVRRQRPCRLLVRKNKSTFVKQKRC